MRKLVLVLLLLAVSAAALERQPNDAYRARRGALAQKTDGAAIVMFAAMEAEGPNALYGFRQDNNFYYLTGWSEPGAALLIIPEIKPTAGHPGRPYSEIFFLPAHNPSQEKWTGPKLGPEHKDAVTLTGFARVELIDKLRDEIYRALPQPRATLYSDLPAYGETSPAAVPLEWLRRANAFPVYITLADVKPLLTQLRMVKDAGELALIQKATAATIAAHRAALQAVKPGVSEREVAALIIHEYMGRGCERPAFAPIVGSGFDSTVLHYSANAGQIDAGELVVIDIGGEYSMYASDITRTLPTSAKFTPRQREIYDIVLGAQQAAIDAFRAGVSTLKGNTPSSLYRVAYEYINTHGKDRQGRPLGQYFVHGLSHHVGLEVHDASDDVAIQPGMVFTIEPGIYIPEENLGVRIEDLFYVDASGSLVSLTSPLPRAPDEIERAMSAR